MKASSIVAFPFLHDHHSHVSLYASFEGLPELGGLDQAAAMRLLGSLPRDRLSLVKGWRTDRLSLGPADLAELPPLIVVNASLHGFAISPSALPLVSELWPEIAEHADDPAWGESNLPRLFVFYGKVAGLDARKLKSFMKKMEALGLGSLEDMTLAGEDALAIFSDSPFTDRIVSWATPEVYGSLLPASREKCEGIKVFLDGSLGACSAALDAPFPGGSVGSLLYSDSELSCLLAGLASFRTKLSAHALGHRAIAQALACLDTLAREGIDFPSVRLEHVQFITYDQARRCKEAGIVLSVQPNFNSDSRDYADRLVSRHCAENDRFRMLIDEAGFVPGVDLLFGSDGMPHGPEYALRWSLFPDYEEQRLSIKEFEAGYGPALGIEGEGSAFAIDDQARTINRIVRSLD
jgi:predicted amidohydrolase YtcJ